MRIRSFIQHCAVSNLLLLSLALSPNLSGCTDSVGDKQLAANQDEGTGAGPSATETNVAGVKCDVSADCAHGVDCIFPNGPGEPGVCDLKHMGLNGSDGGSDAGADAGSGQVPGPHIGAAAQCMTDNDCGPTIKCIFPNGTDNPGVCDVLEMGAR